MPFPSPYYGSDYVIINSGSTFALGADPIYNLSGGYSYYVQYYKLGYGATGAFTAVDASNPFPVTVAAGLTATISGFCGSIQVEGKVGGQAVAVSGNVVVSGLSGAPVYVQTAPNCYVEVTGGRFINKLNDNISVFGPAGNTWIYANLVNSSGSAIGVSSNPMFVNIVGATINATINPTVGVCNSSSLPLFVCGVSGATAINATVGNMVTIDDADIVSGLAGVCAEVALLNANLSTLGLAKPTTFKTGRVSSTYSTTQQMDTSGFTCQGSVSIKALSTNTDFVYVGNTSASASLLSSGYALDPGDETLLDINNTNKVYILAASGTQTITYMAS
jgi:hypothetical protein